MKKIDTEQRQTKTKQNKTKQSKTQEKQKRKQSIIGLYLIKFDDTKGIIRSHSLNDRQYNGQRKRTKWETMVYKTLNRKLKIEKREPHDKSRVNSGTQKWITVPAPHVIPIVLLLTTRTTSDMKIFLDASICEDIHIMLTKHKIKQRSRRIGNRFMGKS